MKNSKSKDLQITSLKCKEIKKEKLVRIVGGTSNPGVTEELYGAYNF